MPPLQKIPDVEAQFVTSFVSLQRRGRILAQLASDGGREKFRRRLAPDFTGDLDPRFVYLEAKMPTAARRLHDVLWQRFVRTNSEAICHVIREAMEIDGRSFPVPGVDDLCRHSLAAILILLPMQLAYYRPEDDEPKYVLLRPPAHPFA